MFSPIVKVRVTAEGTKLFAQASGPRKAYAIPLENRIELQALSATQFTVPGHRYPLVLDFAKPGTLLINPGHWQQSGARQNP